MFFVSVFSVSPSVSSSTHPNQNEWYSIDSISLTWSLNGATECVFVLDNSENTVPNTSTAVDQFSITYNHKKEGVYFFHVKCKTSSGWSDVSNFKIQIDKTHPSRPEDVNVVPLSTGGLKVSWSNATDDASGVKYYNVYRSNLPFVRKGDVSLPWHVYDYVAVLVGEEITGNSFVDTDVCDGCRRHYRVQAVDNAGNVGVESVSVSAMAVPVCDVNFETDFSLNNNNFFTGSIFVNGGENEGLVSKPKVFLISPTGSEEELFSSSSYSVDLIDFNYDFSNKSPGEYFFKIKSFDSEGDDCNAVWSFFFDKVSPVPFLINDFNSALSETVDLKIRVEDSSPSSGIESVEFFLDNNGFVKIGEVTDANNNLFVFHWNTLEYANGRSELKVKVTDNAGNSGELVKLVSIKNTFNIRRDINVLYSSIDSKLENVRDLNSLFLKYNLDLNSFNYFLNQFDSNFVKSKELFESGVNFEASKKFAVNALTALNNALDSIDVEYREPLKYDFNKSNLVSLYSSAGLLPDFIPESVKNVGELGFSRKLNLVRVKQDENVFYLVSIDLILFNNSNEEKEFFLIEPVPKEFAVDSSLIGSDFNLFFVKKDPVFYSRIVVPSKKNFVFNYFLKKPVSFEELVNLSNSINLFDSPSAIVSCDKHIPSNVFSKPIDFNKLFSDLINLITLNSSIDLIWVLLGLGVLLFFGVGFFLLIIIVIGVYLLFFKKKKRERTLSDI